jgi:hypothetical protein
LVLGCNITRFVLEPHYLHVSRREPGAGVNGIPFQSLVRGMMGGSSVRVSMKFKRTPYTQIRLALEQFWQMGNPSSHFKWRCLQVRHPVLTRFGLLAAMGSDGSVLVPTRAGAAGALMVTFLAPFIDLAGVGTFRRCDGGALLSWSLGLACWSPTRVRVESVDAE